MGVIQVHREKPHMDKVCQKSPRPLEHFCCEGTVVTPGCLASGSTICISSSNNEIVELNPTAAFLLD